MSVNISPKQFHDATLIKCVENALRDARLTGKNLVLEITETTLLQDLDQVQVALSELRRLGIRIALDDFGTGYSSLSYLKKYPIDIIKIDRSFVKDILVDKEEAAITQAVLALGRSLNLDIIAEGVDNEAVLAQLGSWGCPHYQGYLLNQPMPAQEMQALLLTEIKRRQVS